MAWRWGWGLFGAALLMAGCSDLSLDAPPPSPGAGNDPTPLTSAAAATPAGESPVWLQQLEGQAGSAGPGGPVQLGLGADPIKPAYSGETLTHGTPGPAGGDTLTQSPETATTAGAQAAKSGAAAANDPVSLQHAALPIVGGFRIQLATLPDPESAVEIWRSLQTAHPKILGSKQMILLDLDLGYRGLFHRLEAGPFETLTAAWEACIALVRRRQGCVVSQP